MSNAAEFWDKRYSEDIGFEELTSEKPSNAVERFIAYLRNRDIPLNGRLLDVGCGMGRNAIWLARQGFEVTGVDISAVAITEAKLRAQRLNVVADFRVVDVSKGLPFLAESVDFMIDVVTNQLLTLEDLKRYKKGVVRILKPGGMFLLYTLDRSVDKGAQKLLEENPGPEKNTYVIPQSGLMERTFTLEEISDLWAPLKIKSSELLLVPTRFKGQVYERYFWWVVLSK